MISVLVTLLFAQKCLPLNTGLDHVEVFAGDMSVSIGEVQAWDV